MFRGGVESNVKITDVLVWTAFLKEHRYKEWYRPVSDRASADLR